MLGWKHERVIGETTYGRLSNQERFEQAYHFATRRLALDIEKPGQHQDPLAKRLPNPAGPETARKYRRPRG